MTDILERATIADLASALPASPSGSGLCRRDSLTTRAGVEETVSASADDFVPSIPQPSAQNGYGLDLTTGDAHLPGVEALETVDQCFHEAQGTGVGGGPSHCARDSRSASAGAEETADRSSSVSPQHVVGGEKRGRRGRKVAEDQPIGAVPSLADMHQALRHASRALLDLKKARVALQLQTKALTRSPEHGGIGMHELQAMATGLPTALDGLDAVETAFEKHLVSLVKQHFMADWIKSVPGAGLPTFALLLGSTGPLDRFANVAKLWAYCGLAVGPNGRAPRRRKGVGMPVGEGNGLSFSPKARVICFQMGECFVKQRKSPYRAEYDRKKAEYLTRERVGPSECPFGHEHKNKDGKVVKCGLAHAEMAAKRYAVKCYLRDLWGEWHRRQPR